jgi:hypothetical protein
MEESVRYFIDTESGGWRTCDLRLYDFRRYFYHV